MKLDDGFGTEGLRLMNPPEIEHFIVCQCGTPDHSLLVSYKDWDWEKTHWHGHTEELIISFHLVTGGLFYRLTKAWKYIWGDYHGHYDEVLINPKEAKKLSEVLKIYIEWEEKKAHSAPFPRKPNTPPIPPWTK